jgi:hypothetical protein
MGGVSEFLFGGVQFRLEGVNSQWGPSKIIAPSYASVALFTRSIIKKIFYHLFWRPLPLSPGGNCPPLTPPSRRHCFCPPFACLQCKGWAIAMTLSVCLSVCLHKTRNCEETERRTKKVLEIKVVGYHDSYSGVPSFVTSDDL